MSTDIAYAVVGAVARVTLDRPAAINALTHAMVRDLDRVLDAALADDAVRTVFLEGAGDRGFCAGGDVVAMRASALVQDGAVQRFWADEYALDLRLSRLAKPVVAFLDGVVMGGGIGLGGHVSHRLVTERTVLAMPEVGIGFAPDVGGTWLLSRPEGEVGTHLALTAGRVGAADGIAIGLADAYVLAADREAVVAALAAGASADEVVATHARPTPTPEEQAWIDAAYRHDTVPEIVAALRARPEPAATKAADDIERMAPTAVAVTLESLRRSRRLPDLEAALAQELRVSDAFTRHPDFAEGIRAQIVDKDRNPTWTPATLGEVTAADVAAFF